MYYNVLLYHVLKKYTTGHKKLNVYVYISKQINIYQMYVKYILQSTQ